MSSILNALKKLESEAPPRTEDAAPALHRAMNVRGTLHNRFKKPRLIRGIGLALAGGIAVAVGVGLYRHRAFLPPIPRSSPDKEVARSSAPAPAARAPKAPPAVPPHPTDPPEGGISSPTPDPGPAPAKPPRVARKAPAAAAKAPDERAARSAPAEPSPPRTAPASSTPLPEPKAAPRQRIAAEDRGITEAPPAPAVSPDGPASGVSIDPLAVKTSPPVAPPAPRADTPAVLEPAPSAPPIPARFADVARRTDPRFHIQALVWSEDAASRMAMVNGSIVKTGDRVGAATIRHIGENFLIFQENGETWRHPFRVQ